MPEPAPEITSKIASEAFHIPVNEQLPPKAMEIIEDKDSQIAELQKKLAETIRRAEKAEAEASTDKLTELLSRRQGDFEFFQEISNVSRGKQALCVIEMDIDYFKGINDNDPLGHTNGDRVLREFAEKIKDSIRGSDTAIRWGGEEFVLLLPQENDSNPKEIRTKLEELHRKINSIKRYSDGRDDKVTISMGAIFIPSGNKLSSKDVFHAIDDNLYKCKNSGRNMSILSTIDEEQVSDIFELHPETQGESSIH